MDIQPPFSLEVEFVDKQNNQVRLRTPDNHEIQWPAANFPQQARLGQKFRVAVLHKDFLAQEREKIAKQILNEILQSNHSDSGDPS